MFWRKKVRLNAPGGVERRRAIDGLIQSLTHRKLSRQYEAVAELSQIAHPAAVEWLLTHITNEETAEWSVRHLERIVTHFPEAIESGSLHFLYELPDPLQRLKEPPQTLAGRVLPPTWKNLLSVDCSSLRQKAAAELQRRAQAELQWRRRDEELKKQRGAAAAAAEDAEKRRMA